MLNNIFQSIHKSRKNSFNIYESTSTIKLYFEKTVTEESNYNTGVLLL